MYLYIEKGRKLQGRLDFQGLPISIENKKGSVRHWYDPKADEHGTTKMLYSYGYVKGTLGLDGDAVDVFVGPEKTSSKVFIVTQMTSPAFKQVDEQKVMLGFISAKEAKSAYLKHYNDPKFFGSMKELSMDAFKTKLKSSKGRLIKCVLMDASKSAKIHSNTEGVSMTEVSKAAIQCPKCDGNDPKCENCGGDGDMSKADPVAILRSVSAKMSALKAEKLEKNEDDEDVEKALKAAAVHGMSRARRIATAIINNTPLAAVDDGAIGTIRMRGEHEPPVVPIRHVDTPPPSYHVAPDFLKSCGSCGYVHKSIDDCPRCESVQARNRPAVERWRR